MRVTSTLLMSPACTILSALKSVWATRFISVPNRMRLSLAKLGRTCEKYGARMRIKNTRPQSLSIKLHSETQVSGRLGKHIWG